MKKKRVLYAAIKYPYANPRSGLSYEYYNFLNSLHQMDELEVEEFDWVGISIKWGREKMNELLLRKVNSYKPDLVFFSIFKEEFKKDVVKKISERTLTYNWFFDDVGRFNSYTQYWAPIFSYVATNISSMLKRYKEIGCKNVIVTRLGVNTEIFGRLKLPKDINVSFVGQVHSNRRRMIHELEKRGIPVKTWGRGWKKGPIDLEKMIGVFNKSKINLNFTLTSFSFPLGRFLPWFVQPLKVSGKAMPYCVNGRILEVPACGGLLITEDAPDLDRYFKKDKEILVFKEVDELYDKVHYYLNHDNEREKIAKAGYKRVLKEHSYKDRFIEIFKKIGILN